jgi:Mg-chelatase subunit ChlD
MKKDWLGRPGITAISTMACLAALGVGVGCAKRDSAVGTSATSPGRTASDPGSAVAVAPSPEPTTTPVASASPTREEGGPSDAKKTAEAEPHAPSKPKMDDFAKESGAGKAERKPSAPMPAPTMAGAARAARPSGPMPTEKGSAWSDDTAGGFGVSAQFSGVKAGEWDDNANFHEFQRFLASSPTNHRRMNLGDRRFLVVRDKDGHAVPRCRITVHDSRQASTSYLTTASGRAILFPHAEGMTGEKLTATASCGEGTAEASFPLFDQQDGVVDLKLAATRAPVGNRIVDLAFVLDTTGSMSEEISAVKSTIQKVAKVLSTEQTTVRVGLVEYKDRSDPFVTKVYPFATDLSGFAQKVSQISASGGGDTPEDMNAGLHSAMTQLAWSDRSVARLAFVIADAPPHLDYQDGADYAADMKTASHRGIQLFTVAASGMDNLGQVVFRQMAQFTGGTNMFVLRGGAGPQSTGGGDPASSCGGTHTNYSSGKLDELIVQKIRRELRALDADPMRIAGLRTDENAKPCDQRVVFID